MGELNNAIIMLQIYQSALFAILSFAMFFRYGNYSKKYLGWFMVLSAVFALTKSTGSQGYYQLFMYIFPLGVAMLLAFFPLFYFYLKSLIIPGYRFHMSETAHLLPAILLFLLPVPFSFLPDVRQVPFAIADAGQPGHSWQDIFRYGYDVCVYGCFSVQIVFYSTKIAHLFRVHKSNIVEAFSYTRHIKLAWVIILMMLFLLFLIFLGLSQFIGLGKYPLFRNGINVMEFLIILSFAIFALLQQDIYPEREAITSKAVASGKTDSLIPVKGDLSGVSQTANFNATIEPCDEEDCCRVKKYAGSGLTERQKNALGKKLDKLMKEKLYLNAKLTIDEVAEKLDTNSKYLSQLINEYRQKNFYTYINTFRIEEAQRLLKDRQHQKYSIQGIARLAGFSSKSSFNEAFRRITGMTPSEYLEKNSEITK